MKKVLLSAHCKTQEHKDIVQALVEIISSKGYCIDTIISFDKDYDMILAYNLNGYRRISRLAKTKNIPVVYIVKQEDCVEECLYDVSFISRFLIINGGDDLSHQLFPKECATYIPYPYLPPQQDRVSPNTSSGILVATDDKTLLKMIPALNNYTKYHFTIITGIPSVVKKMLNANCTVVAAKRTTIVDLIKNAALVIGSGKTILTSIGYGKPVIVAGKYGFGRRITPENVAQHYYSLFKGRLGAQGEEVIPFHLLSHEIDACMNAQPKENQAIANSLLDFLTAKYEQTATLIDALIGSAIKLSHVNAYLDIPFVLSSIYRFIALDASSYMVVEDRTLKVHGMIDQDEYHLIHSFEAGATAKTIMQKNLYHKTPKRFVSFIKYLVTYKFLVPYDQRTDF
ncbi:hypothetical protein FACS1894182_06870 [Bacteroidia bacterium]|nr:hypothetical protein FACS1894182_06870 [Bacteroidia bacterium]